MSILKIGIECESIENDTWGVARLTSKLLEEIDRRPELKKEFEFYLYFKSKIPDYPYLENPIFKKKIIKPPVIPSSFSLYYYIYLPIFLWFKRVDVMFFPNYMLPLIFFGKSIVMLTDDIYYESRNPKLPFRFRLAYRIFAGWSAMHASKILAISQTSKKELVRLFKIKPERIAVNYLGVDTSNMQTVNNGSPYILYVGQAFPRRHLKETILAFEKLITQHIEHTNKLENVRMSEIKLIAIGPDKYETPVIKSLVAQVNSRLNRQAIIHKDYVKDSELAELYAGARALVYVSDREAFGLPPMEALSFGVPPIIADNELGHELFGEYAFYVKNVDVEGITDGIRQVLTQTEKIQKIKTDGPEFVKKYNWKNFANNFFDELSKGSVDNNYIAKHYDDAFLYYKYLWSRESNAIHYGFWDKDTKNVNEALLNENKFLAEVADIKPSDTVLDAGCGVGGSSIWITKNIGASVIGITLSDKQLKEARRLVLEYNVNAHIEFKIDDYLHTNFPDNTFDVVWAIESVCYAKNKIDFLIEAYRILKPGGRIIIADGFLDRDLLETDKKLFNDILTGFAIPNLAKIINFKKDMEIAGFKEIKHWDKTVNVKKSLKILYTRVMIGYPILKLTNLIGLVPNTVVKYGPVGIAQYKLFNNGLLKYEVFFGKK